jgi:hypothetical protein
MKKVMWSILEVVIFVIFIICRVFKLFFDFVVDKLEDLMDSIDMKKDDL